MNVDVGKLSYYVKRVSIFLITVALVMGLASCESTCAPLLQYALSTLSTLGGTVTILGEGTSPYPSGATVVLVATPDACYRFVEWTGDVDDIDDVTSATITITIAGDKNVTANFALLSYDLTADSTDGGEVTTPSEGTFTYDCGTVVDLVAEAEEGYRFVQWAGDVDDIDDVTSPTITITMNGDYSITAEFAWQYYLSINSTGGGSVTEPGEGVFPCDEGSVVDLVAEAEESYHFVQWTGNVSNITDVYAAETTITMNGDYSITANFILFAGGSGTAENPYQIADWRHLDNVCNYLNHHFIVINDLDLNSIGYTELASATANEGKGWEPIGPTAENDKFAGSFDGQGHEICDLFIDRPAESNVGLFGVVGEGGVIENVGVVNVNVTGQDDVGGLVGKNEGTVSNSYSSGSVTGDDYIGGLMGKNEGTASNSYSTSSVTGNNRVGGLIGQNSEAMSNSYSTGSVTGNDYVGGLVGRNEGTASNSFWDTQTSGQASSDGGTGKATAEMQDIVTFTDTETEGLDEPWDITAVDSGETNPACIWNIVDTVTYPFLSWESVV